MTLVKRNEEYPVWSTFFNDFFGRNFLDLTSRSFSKTNTTLPSVNIMEDEDKYLVEVAAPGFVKEDFDLKLKNNVLTISSDKKEENEVKEGEYYSRKEFSYQSFSRSFSLPDTIQVDKIGAKYDKGILTVTLPKRDEAKPKPALQIEIK
ncbi:MAG: Hsp20/alpha crystallin family protein [Bacteroidales bacterium]|jgi:HSP20 family protein|nr:Hsp20/alpha crystallin family protein [Bacteroidales bacterium]HHT53274.1 Hsp20/alpha crystallin family protein [Bacteroidales bacterium]